MRVSALRDFICTFTSGRTGTALLAQIISGVVWAKGAVNSILDLNGDRVSVGHEGWNLQISKIKKTVNRSRDIRILNNILKSYNSRVIFTDNRIGRFFGPVLQSLSRPVKVIRLSRDSSSVIDSFIRRIEGRRRSHSIAQFRAYYESIWRDVLYHPQDVGTINKCMPKKWERMAIRDKLGWYCREVESRWQVLESELSIPIFNANYTDLISGVAIESLSEFIGIKCYNMTSKWVNRS